MQQNRKISNSQRNEIARALSAIGGEGVNTGVTLANGKIKDGNSRAETTSTTDLGFLSDSNGNLTPTIKITFNEKASTIDGEDVAHEATHAANRMDLAPALKRSASLEDYINSPENITTYANEYRAYMVGSAVSQGLERETYNANGVEYWNKGWSKTDRETKRQAGVNKVLREQYDVTSQQGQQGKRLNEPRK